MGIRRVRWILGILLTAAVVLVGWSHMRPASPGDFEWPRSAEQAVFQISSGGGLIGRLEGALDAPELTVFGDGRVLFTRGYRTYRDMYETRIPEGQLRPLLLRAARDLAELKETYEPIAPVMDGGGTVFALVDGKGQVKRVSISTGELREKGIRERLEALEKFFRDQLPANAPKYVADDVDFIIDAQQLPQNATAPPDQQWPAGLPQPPAKQEHGCVRIRVTGEQARELSLRYSPTQHSTFRVGDTFYTVAAAYRIPNLWWEGPLPLPHPCR